MQIMQVSIENAQFNRAFDNCIRNVYASYIDSVPDVYVYIQVCQSLNERGYEEAVQSSVNKVCLIIFGEMRLIITCRLYYRIVNKTRKCELFSVIFYVVNFAL